MESLSCFLCGKTPIIVNDSSGFRKNLGFLHFLVKIPLDQCLNLLSADTEPFFCKNCEDKISQGLELSNRIQDLQLTLNEIQTSLRGSLVSQYNESRGNDNEGPQNPKKIMLRSIYEKIKRADGTGTDEDLGTGANTNLRSADVDDHPQVVNDHVDDPVDVDVELNEVFDVEVGRGCVQAQNTDEQNLPTVPRTATLNLECYDGMSCIGAPPSDVSGSLSESADDSIPIDVDNLLGQNQNHRSTGQNNEGMDTPVPMEDDGDGDISTPNSTATRDTRNPTPTSSTTTLLENLPLPLVIDLSSDDDEILSDSPEEDSTNVEKVPKKKQKKRTTKVGNAAKAIQKTKKKRPLKSRGYKDEGEGVLEVVEKILDYKVFEIEGPCYHIKWKGFSNKHNSWEPPENLSGCNESLIAFYKKRKAIVENQKKRGRTPWDLPPEPQPRSPSDSDEASSTSSE